MDEIKEKSADLRRVSACPLHFLWDGRGDARRLVRGGFTIVILAMALKTGVWIWPALGLNALAGPALMFGSLLWVYGQLKSAWLVFSQKRAQ